ncbi:MAG: hypothetical protein ABJH98_02215 [Reichenbachiella sp.]|uniref:hypothetical protein n=1 Tax=Reichenbachiella sp. TaxID=2184521 RepID=UPI003297DF88
MLKSLITVLFLSVLLFNCQFAIGQKNFQPGYILTLGGDTIRGQIDYRNWKINPDQINFIDPSSIEQTFSPLEILEFGVADERYLSGIVDYETSSTLLNFSKMSQSGQFDLASDTVFLQELFGGNKPLYFFYNNQQREYFYIENNNKLELLNYKKYLKKSPSADPDAPLAAHNSAVAENNRFRAQLMAYLSDCSSVNSKITSAGYGQKSMYRIFESYEKCVNPEGSNQRKREKIETKFGVLAGVSLSSIKFSGTDNYNSELIESDFGSSVDFTAGVSIEFVFPRSGRKWSIPNELIYTSFSVEADHSDITDPDYLYTISHIELAYSYIKLNNMVRYSIPIGNIHTFINVGLSNGFAISETNNMTQTIQAYSSTRNTEEEAIEFTRKYEQGLIAGLGVRANKISFEARYEGSGGMSEAVNLSSKVKRFYFMLGYRF